ncbi:MAG: TVP38/TMEM64 family protein [Candidatus Methylumidiphilus sp.]
MNPSLAEAHPLSFLAPPTDQATHRPDRRWPGVVHGGVLLATLALGVLVYCTPLQAWLAEGEAIKAQLRPLGVAAPLLFSAAAALLTAVGVPRLLLCSLAGMAFGFAWGLAWAQLGTVLGSYAVFLLVRWRGRAYTLAHFPRLSGFTQSLESRGLLAVLLIRQLPVNGFYNSVFLGLTPVSHGEFLLGSLLGFLPLGVTACLLGAGLIQSEMLKGAQYLAWAAACSVGLGLFLNRWAQTRREVAYDEA